MKRLVIILLLTINSLYAFEEIMANNIDEKLKNKYVILDFYATWCPPCKIVEKHLKLFSKKSPNVVVYKIDIDKNREIASLFNVKSIPTLVYVKNGKPIFKEVGVRNHTIISNNVDNYLINN